MISNFLVILTPLRPLVLPFAALIEVILCCFRSLLHLFRSLYFSKMYISAVLLEPSLHCFFLTPTSIYIAMGLYVKVCTHCNSISGNSNSVLNLLLTSRLVKLAVEVYKTFFPDSEKHDCMSECPVA